VTTSENGADIFSILMGASYGAGCQYGMCSYLSGTGGHTGNLG